MDANDASKFGISVSPEDIESLLETLATGQREDQIQSLKALAEIDVATLGGELRRALQDTLVTTVAESHYKVGIVAIAALMAHQCKGADVEQVLLAACASEVLVVRWKAITALGRLGIDTPAVLGALRSGLQDPNGNVARAAAKALCAVAQDNQEAALVLLGSLEDEHVELFRIIRPLVEGVTIGDPAPFFNVIKRTSGTLQQQLLAFLLKHTSFDGPGRAEAILALLCELMESKSDVLCLDVCRGLRLLQFSGYEIQAAIPGLFKLLERPGDAIKMQALLTFKVVTLDVALCRRLLQSFQDNDNRNLMNHALDCVTGLAPADVTASFLEEVMALLTHPDQECRNKVIDVLRRFGRDTPQVTQRFLRLLEEERHIFGYMIRIEMVDSLDHWGVEEDAYVSALKVCLGAEHVEERERALLALGNMGAKAEAAVHQVVACLRSAEATERESAVLAVASMGPVVLSPLMELLDDPDDALVQRVHDAIMALGQEAVALLADGLTHEDAYHRADCASLLARVEPKDTQLIPALLDGLSDPCSWVRRHCAEALGVMAMQLTQVVSALGGLLADPEWDVQAAAAEALASYPDAIHPHVPALLELLGHSHQEVRCAAVIALDTCISPAQPAVTSALQHTASQDTVWYIRTLAQESLQGIALCGTRP